VTVAARDIAPEIDVPRALAALGHGDATEVEAVTGGWDTLIWRFRGADGEMRSLRVHWLPDRERTIAVETAALRQCEAVGFPAPKLERLSEFEGLPAAVLSWLPGTPILAVLEKRPWRMRRLARLMGATQARLHACPPPDELREGAPERWLNLIEPGFEHLADGLRELRPATASLIHMDYHPLNVLTDGRGLTGVVDWPGAAAGDPRADLARTAVTLATAPIPPGPAKPMFAAARRLLLRWWRQGYAGEAGSLPDYTPFLRWAAASLLREVRRVIQRPGVWAEAEYVDVLSRLASKPSDPRH
jgi:aminoglycoside phosphotransferase (APT) family kinase protein